MKTKREEDSSEKDNTAGKHILQNHYVEPKDTAAPNKEPTLRSSTTDSSRVPKNSNDDLPTGGNIR